MGDNLLYISKELDKMLDEKGVVVFRDNNKQPYAIFKLKDEKGAVAGFGENGLFMVQAMGKSLTSHKPSATIEM